MTLEAPKNPNYAAHVIEVKSVEPIKGKDRIHTIHADGYAAIVSKDVQPGSIGVLFPPETQLSDFYASSNNLYRHTDRNADPEQSGYLEDNRRVKAIKFAGARSEALFMSLESLSMYGYIYDLKVGDTFDYLNGSEVCRKYVLKEPIVRAEKALKFRVLDERTFPQHFDTDNYFRVRESYYGDEDIVVTQKLHGTSIRFGTVPVATELKWYERLAKRIGIRVAAYEPASVVGSRRVVKSIKRSTGTTGDNGQHFYGDDIYTAAVDGITLPEGYIAYGELVGYTPDGKQIQRDYAYEQEPGTAELYVYRVAIVTGGGRVTDLSWDQVRYFCQDNGLVHVPELFRGKLADFQAEDWLDQRYANDFRNAVRLSNGGTVDEGVVIRVDERQPRFLKAKSPAFLRHETKMLDDGAEDLESEG